VPLPPPGRVRRRLDARRHGGAGGWGLGADKIGEGPTHADSSSPSPQSPTPSPSVLDVLAALVDNSLVVVAQRAIGPGRLRLLETLRAYALEKLETASEVALARQCHADYYTDLAVRSDTRKDFLDKPGALARLQRGSRAFGAGSRVRQLLERVAVALGDGQ